MEEGKRGLCVVVTGVPHTGKTPLAKAIAERLGWEVIHTDDFMDAVWDFVPGMVLGAIRARERPVVVEGVAAARLFTRGLRPQLCVVCVRDGLAEPSHKGMSVWVKKRVEMLKAERPELVIEVDSRADVVDELIRRIQDDSG